MMDYSKYKDEELNQMYRDKTKELMFSYLGLLFIALAYLLIPKLFDKELGEMGLWWTCLFGAGEIIQGYLVYIGAKKLAPLKAEIDRRINNRPSKK